MWNVQMMGPTEVRISWNEAEKESALVVRYQSTSKTRHCRNGGFHRLNGEAQLCTHSSSDPCRIRQVASGNRQKFWFLDNTKWCLFHSLCTSTMAVTVQSRHPTCRASLSLFVPASRSKNIWGESG